MVDGSTDVVGNGGWAWRRILDARYWTGSAGVLVRTAGQGWSGRKRSTLNVQRSTAGSADVGGDYGRARGIRVWQKLDPNG